MDMRSQKVLFQPLPRPIAQIGLLVALACMSACSSIPSRIRDNQRQFDTLPEQAQLQIQSGRIDHGFTEEMVYMAKGKPDDKYTAKVDGKQITVWKYASRTPALHPTSPPGSLAGQYGYPGFGPSASQPTPMFYERQYFKVEFENGKVVRWDRDLQDDPELKELSLPEAHNTSKEQ